MPLYERIWVRLLYWIVAGLLLVYGILPYLHQVTDRATEAINSVLK